MHPMPRKRPEKQTKRIKQMKITESKLRQIILEEIQMIELEELLVAEAVAMGITLTEEQKKSILQRLAKAAKRYGAGLALGAGLAAGGAGLHGLQTDYAQGIKDQVAQNVAAAEEYNASPEAKSAALKKQLDNTAAWLWSVSDDPTDMSYLPVTDSGAGVLPPEWSVMKKVHDDFTAGNDPEFSPEDVISATGNAEQNRTNFMQDFEDTQFENWGGSRGIQGSIYMNFDDLPESYSMPLTGQSPSEYYVQLWDQYVGY